MRTIMSLNAATGLLLALLGISHQVAGFLSPVPRGGAAATGVVGTRGITKSLSSAVVPLVSSSPCSALFSTVAPEEDKAMEKDVLKSECGMDYVPLANMLLIGDFKGADQFTRDALIKIAGEGAQKRGYVYFTEVKNLPQQDMATIEKLWLKYSKGKFGFTVQRQVWNQVTVAQDFERFCRKIGWNTVENGIERKLKWFGKSEFIYELDKAPVGHLPLTSALRGTSLLKNLLNYPMWSTDWNKEEK